MSIPFEPWPFLPLNQQNEEQQKHWFEECFLPSTALAQLCERPGWRMLIGRNGCGRTTALYAFARLNQSHALIVWYPALFWPCSKEALQKAGNHLSQIMTLVARAVREETLRQPERLAELSESSQVFMHWLIERFLGNRMFVTWLSRLSGRPGTENLRDHEYKNLYHTDTDSIDVQGQVGELLDLINELGYQEIFILMDVPLFLSEPEKKNLTDLFCWLGLMQYPGFIVVAAIPSMMIERMRLIQRARDRVSTVYLEWSEEQARQIAGRCLKLATGGRLCELEDLAGPAVLTDLEQVIRNEYGGPSPQGWIRMMYTLLEMGLPRCEQLEKAERGQVLRRFFGQYMRLAMDPDKMQQGIWRGPHFIQLDEQRFKFLKVFFEQGQKAKWINDELLKVAKSKDNMYQLASRLRVDIDPILEDDQGDFYLHNNRSEGYWLEHFDLPDVINEST